MDVVKHKPNLRVIHMAKKVQKSANSLGVSSPNDLVKRINVKQGLEIFITAERETTIWKAKNRNPTLKDLVDQIRTENYHREMDSGCVGREFL